MDALKQARRLFDVIHNGPGLSALELADTVSGGHIKEAARTSDEMFSAEVDDDTRSAALNGLDLARLNHARFRVVLELLDKILEVQDELAEQWKDQPEDEWPELRDLQAASALVATGYARQQSRQRRQLIVTALRGSFCPGPYLWGFQDELLRHLVDSGLTEHDVQTLREILPDENITIDAVVILTSLEMDSYERLAKAEFITMHNTGRASKVIRDRWDIPAGGLSKVNIRRTHKETKFLVMIDAGRSVSTQAGCS